MKLYIKNMVCGRCIMVVKSKLEKLGLHTSSIQLGVVDLKHPISKTLKQELSKQLIKIGFELIDDKKSKIIEKIKTLIIDLVHRKNNQLDINLSSYIANHILQDYNTVSNLFSAVEGITIEHYYIAQKIEKVKELIMYDELNLNEISLQLNYSSVAYLSSQFKKITGFTPTQFKKTKENKRSRIEEL